MGTSGRACTVFFLGEGGGGACQYLNILYRAASNGDLFFQISEGGHPAGTDLGHSYATVLIPIYICIFENKCVQN